MRSWKKIVCHCSASPNGDTRFTIDDYRRWHKAKGWRDVGYHAVCELDGSVSIGRPESMSGAHTTGQNSVALGICMTGTSKYTKSQFLSLRKKLQEWMQKYDIPVSEIYGHYQFANKSCPGFKIEPLRKFIETGDLSHMQAHLLDGETIEQPGEDMGGEDEVKETIEAVKNLQSALNQLGAELKVDGLLGPKTKAAMLKIANQ